MQPPPTHPPTVLDWLARRFPTAKRQTLRRMVEAGRVMVNGHTARAARQPLDQADDVLVSDNRRKPPPAHGPRLQIIYEDDDLLVAVKPAGLLTSTVPRERRPTLLAMVRQHVERAAGGAPRVGLIHRLDRDASGLLVFSKNHEAYRSLKQQFFDHTVERVYTAVVTGVPTPRAGRIESRLLERADGTVYSTDQPGKGERAVTEYQVVEEGGGKAVLRVKLHTGRKHQIRVHLRERGTPIVGDPIYGRDAGPKSPVAKSAAGKSVAAPGPLLLAATKLSLTHPRTHERKTFELPRPKWSMIQSPNRRG